MYLDTEAASLISSIQSPTLTLAMEVVTYLGSFLSGVIIVGVLLWMRKRGEAKMVLAGIAMNAAVIFPIKHLVARARPENALITVDWLVDTAEYSFPSGHAAMGFMMAILLSSIFGRKYFFYTLAFLIAFSRLYLGVHYLSDVVAGAVIGVALGSMILRHKERLMRLTI